MPGETGDREGRGSRYDRKLQHKCEREKGKKRHHRSLEEKLLKYRASADGYEFIPLLMHVLTRYASGVPEGKATELDRRMATALDEIPEARSLIERAVKVHAEIPAELKRSIFSPRYLNLPPEHAIDVAEAGEIVQRAAVLRNRPVSAIPSLVGRLADHTKPSVGCCCDDDKDPPPPPPPPPPANQYELTFTKLYCVDESDPEWFGSDEPYVVFGVITEAMAEAGTAAWAFHTPVYEDVDDGDTRPSGGNENLRLFGFAGPTAITSSALVTGSCFEHDLGDVSGVTNAVRAALTAVATGAASAGGVPGWIVAGVAVIGIGVTYLVDLIGADDAIGGSVAITLSEADADARTAAVNPAILSAMHFDGGDDDGIYDAYLALRRA